MRAWAFGFAAGMMVGLWLFGRGDKVTLPAPRTEGPSTVEDVL